MECLFIGGPADGIRKEVNDSSQAHEVVTRKKTHFMPVDMSWKEVAKHVIEFDRTVYGPMHFEGNDRKFTIYALPSMTADQLIEKLIERYPKPA